MAFAFKKCILIEVHRLQNPVGYFNIVSSIQSLVLLSQCHFILIHTHKTSNEQMDFYGPGCDTTTKTTTTTTTLFKYFLR